MRTFADILKRHGFKESDFCSNGHCGDLLRQTIISLGHQPALSEIVNEQQWIDSMDKSRRKVDAWGRETIVDPDVSSVPLADLDSHIRGIVRWTNELGLTTIFSCDGHDRHSAFVDLRAKPTKEQLKMLQSLLPNKVLGYSFSRHNRLFFRYPTGQKELLLEYAEMLHDAVCNEEILCPFLEM